MKRQAYEPILITDAPRSPDDQLRGRQVRYLVMMSIRAVCLIVGAILVGAEAPLLWLWLPLCGVGMVLVPWLAVLIANDRPPKERHRLGTRSRRAAGTTAPGALPAREPGPVIDVDPCPVRLG